MSAITVRIEMDCYILLISLKMKKQFLESQFEFRSIALTLPGILSIKALEALCI